MEGRSLSVPATSPDAIPVPNPIQMKLFPQHLDTVIHVYNLTPISQRFSLIASSLFPTLLSPKKPSSHRCTGFYTPFLRSAVVTLRIHMDLTHDLSYVTDLCVPDFGILHARPFYHFKGDKQLNNICYSGLST